MSRNAILSVKGVTKAFGGLIAVDSVSFNVRENEVLGLIGPNGSGKTTIINLISGALNVSAGLIRFDGRRISGMSPQRITKLGVARTFQLVRLLPSLSVLENVIAGEVFGHVKRWGRFAQEHARRMLSTVGLEEMEHLPVSALTYIDQKRLELARVLASDPELLLLDEWLAGLNPTELETGIKLIRKLRDEGLTIILVEHVVDAIRSLCDTCVVMNSGRKIAEGIPSEVLSNKEVVCAYLGDDDA
jgi:ABC-type branched-subunit amino acid transport system ATPase component